MTHEYAGLRRVNYKTIDNGDMCFVPVCPTCGRFVKADKTVSVNGLGELAPQPNATCAKCGRVKMLFEGYF